MFKLKRLFASIGLRIEENKTITRLSGGIQSVVKCNKKPIVVSDGILSHLSRPTNKNIVFNTHSNIIDCSFLLMEKQIHEILFSKIHVLAVNTLKIIESPESYNDVKSKNLKKSIFKLVRDEIVDFDYNHKDSLLNKWMKIYEKMSDIPLQDGLIKFIHKFDNVCIENEKDLKWYRKAYKLQDKDNVIFIYFASYILVEFPLYKTLTTTKEKVLGVPFEKNELEILKAVFKYIFNAIDRKNAYSVLDKTFLKDKPQENIKNVYLVDNMKPSVTPTMLLIETFNSLATHIDGIIDDINGSEKLIEKFNLNLTMEEMKSLKSYNEFIPNNVGSSYDFKAEIKLHPRIKFEEFNKQLNQPLKKVDKTPSKEAHRPRSQKRSISLAPMQGLASSSFGMNELENSSYILDSTQESFKHKIPDKERKRHTYILAGSGSGKTSLIETFLYDECQKTDQSTIIFDLMGKASQSVLKFVKDPKRVLLIDPYMHSSITPVINPFELDSRDELSIENRTKAIINASDIALNLKDGWSVNMKAVLAPCISTLLRKGDSDIYELQKFMNDEVNGYLVKLGQESPVRGHSNFFNQEFLNESYDVTKRAISAKLQVFLNDPTFSNLTTGKSTINLKKEVNTKGKIIIFKLPSKQKLFARLMMETIQDIMRERINESEDEIVPTHIYLDEFQNYLAPTIEEILSESRNYKLYVTFAHQSFVHLNHKMQGIVLSNSNIKIVGQCSYDDGKKMSKEMKADFETIQALEQGEFVFKVGSNAAVKWKNTDRFINDTTPYQTKERTKHMKYQFKHYYTYKECVDLVSENDSEITELKPKHEDF